ncbi:hypothetical protein [Novosphingobium album (ex Liu et al. 2023)]|uniref:hypothetical protein n=1 Tax=Novosphingobium album (ex Liu et al. 2023) TaxID=3031130 RepID=UPI0023B07D5B|nr:hypothetical protein [Novosphingobium album (ex Liu et al. 2023)]
MVVVVRKDIPPQALLQPLRAAPYDNILTVGTRIKTLRCGFFAALPPKRDTDRYYHFLSV